MYSIIPDVIKPPWMPKDGPGPRGVPDCYYRSRVLDSTARYVKFVNALRKEEHRVAVNDAADAAALLDRQRSEFNGQTDRRNCVKNVACRVDLCVQSYEEDLDKNRERLREQLTLEEEKHIRMLVEQAQAGKDLIAKDKEDRLKYLTEKRRVADITAHRAYHDYLTDSERFQRNVEEKMIHQYQIREKQALKSKEMEFDKMWHAVAMKHDEALALRMEYDATDRYRRDMDCKKYSDITRKSERWQKSVKVIGSSPWKRRESGKRP